jgi:ArsR family transcriptional regulator, arsenate/arsenite/antimonite-responsive transcriptional repressor
MTAKQRTMYEARARIIKALAHPARLLIVDELVKAPACVCALRDMVGADLSTVSKHLSVLKNAGIVVDEKRGSQVFYSLRCPCVADFFTCAEKVLKTTAMDHRMAIKG